MTEKENIIRFRILQARQDRKYSVRETKQNFFQAITDMFKKK